MENLSSAQLSKWGRRASLVSLLLLSLLPSGCAMFNSKPNPTAAIEDQNKFAEQVARVKASDSEFFRWMEDR